MKLSGAGCIYKRGKDHHGLDNPCGIVPIHRGLSMRGTKKDATVWVASVSYSAVKPLKCGAMTTLDRSRMSTLNKRSPGCSDQFGLLWLELYRPGQPNTSDVLRLSVAVKGM